MAKHGTLGEYNADQEEWSVYAERLEHYFTANDVKDASKRRANRGSSGSISGQQTIAVKELIPIQIAALIWGRSWSGQKVLCHCDNEVVVAAIRSRSSAQTQIMHLLRCLFFIEASSNFSLAAEYITSADNAIADALS